MLLWRLCAYLYHAYTLWHMLQLVAHANDTTIQQTFTETTTKYTGNTAASVQKLYTEMVSPLIILFIALTEPPRILSI